MRLARVTGTVTATAKHPALTGAKMLLADAVDPVTGVAANLPMVAVDTCGAGVGDTVLVAEGSAARIPPAIAGAPVDAAIVAIVDAVNTD